MRIDLVDEVEGFGYESGLDVESFLAQNSQPVGQPYNHHTVKKDGQAVQRIKAHFRIGECDIYQDRIVEYTLEGTHYSEVRHELSFSGNQQIAQGFLETLLHRYT